MVQQNAPETWKEVSFDFEFINDYRLEVSTHGRLRSFNKLSNGNILHGSMINGYRIVRLKFHKERDPQSQRSFDLLRQQTHKLRDRIKELTKAKAPEEEIMEAKKLHVSLKKNLSKKFSEDLHKRTVHYQNLVHRIVAATYCEKPTPEHTLVAHKDFDKLNNHYTNLVWMTPNENYAHQQHSPIVIAEKATRSVTRQTSSKATKLTVTKVMLLKKLLNEGKPIKQLVKQFKVTDTQILRIKRGENWGQVGAAE